MTFDINPNWGSHVGALRAELSKLDAGALVVEHGAGMYSSVEIARHDVRVICAEEAPGWQSWAAWVYADRDAQIVDRWKHTVPILDGAALVFIDGRARDRSKLLGACLERRVPVIILHDTEQSAWHEYGWSAQLIGPPGYDAEHHGELPRTTVLRRRG